MSVPSVSLLAYLRMRLRIASLGEAQRVRQALWLGAPTPPGASAVLVALQSLSAALVLAVFAAGASSLLRSAREAYAQALDRALPPVPATAADGGLSPHGPGALPPGSAEHRAMVEFLFSRETRQTIQKRHDRWQDLYGDAIYRTSLKPLAAERAARAYLGAVLTGYEGSPVAFAREISPEDLERYAIEAETEFLQRGGAMGLREREALKIVYSAR